MKSFLVPINLYDLEYLFKYGSLIYHDDLTKINITNGDRLLLYNNVDSMVVGPFIVLDNKPQYYVGKPVHITTNSCRKMPQILCSIESKIGSLKYGSISDALILDDDNFNHIVEGMNLTYCSPNDSITGDFEIDGLLNVATFNPTIDKYCIKFLIADDDLLSYYMRKLDDLGISARKSNKNMILVDNVSVCDQCIEINYTEMIGNDLFIIGFLAPQMSIVRSYPGSDAILEFMRHLAISNQLDNSLLSNKNNTGMIISKDSYGNAYLCPLSINKMPFEVIIRNNFVDNYDFSSNVSDIDPELDSYRYKAASEVLKYIFKLSNYSVTNQKTISDFESFDIEFDDMKKTIVCVSEFNSRLISYLDNLDNPDSSYVVLVKNVEAPYLKIVPTSRLLHWHFSHIHSDNFYKDIEYLLYNLEGNPDVEVCNPVVSELRFKISKIWSV